MSSKRGLFEQMRNIVARTGEEIVKADNIARPYSSKSVAQVRAEKPRAAGYKHLDIVGIPGHIDFQSAEAGHDA